MEKEQSVPRCMCACVTMRKCVAACKEIYAISYGEGYSGPGPFALGSLWEALRLR